MSKKLDHEKLNSIEKASNEREIQPEISGAPELKTFKGNPKQSSLPKPEDLPPNKNEYTKCTKCKKYLKASKLKNHMNRCHTPRACLFCGIVIHNLKDYERHVKKCKNKNSSQL